MRRRRAAKICPYCGGPMSGSKFSRKAPTKDHVNPKALGGGPTITVCAACNNLKGKMPLEDWLEFIIENRPARVPHIMREFRAISYRLHIPKEGRLRSVLRAAQQMADELSRPPESHHG